jgi:hypothetical protein
MGEVETSDRTRLCVHTDKIRMFRQLLNAEAEMGGEN